jgi:hypothetical protein
MYNMEHRALSNEQWKETRRKIKMMAKPRVLQANVTITAGTAKQSKDKKYVFENQPQKPGKSQSCPTQSKGF